MNKRPRQHIRRLASELTDTLRVIAYADTTETFIRERQAELRAEYGSCIPKEGMHARGHVQTAYLLFMRVLEHNKPEDVGQACEDILHDCLSRYL